jgi:tetratricopeptide (TPR) repeat protein
MNWREKLEEVEKKRAQGEQLIAAGAFEKAKGVLEQAYEQLEACHKWFKDPLSSKLDEARTHIIDKNMQLGDAYWAEGNLEMARECFTICLDLARSIRERDEVQIKLGQIDQKEAKSENLEKLGRKVEENPDSPEAIYDFATELALERYLPEAIRYLEKLTQLTPDDADVYYRLGNAYLDSRRFDEARAAYEKVLGLDYEDRAEIHYRLGCLELEQHANALEAKRQFEKALSIRPDLVECLKRMARINKLEEKFDGAIDCLASALKHEPDDAGMWLELGDLHENLGKMTRAKECWAKAIEVEPEGDAAEYAQEKLDRILLEEESSREISTD